jgi:trk system potassium uptake protein TrkA
MTKMKIKLKVIEKKREQCISISEHFPDAMVINGDGSDQELLDSENLNSYDAFVALTGDDGSNIITSMYAKSCNVGKIVVKVNQDYYSDILAGANLDSVVTPRMLISQQMARFVRALSNSEGSSMETLYKLADGKVEAMEFKVEEGSLCIGRPLKNMSIKKNTIVAAIVRGKETIIPDGNTQICSGDHVVIIAMAGKVKTLDGIIEVL